MTTISTTTTAPTTPAISGMLLSPDSCGDVDGWTTTTHASPSLTLIATGGQRILTKGSIASITLQHICTKFTRTLLRSSPRIAPTALATTDAGGCRHVSAYSQRVSASQLTCSNGDGSAVRLIADTEAMRWTRSTRFSCALCIVSLLITTIVFKLKVCSLSLSVERDLFSKTVWDISVVSAAVVWRRTSFSFSALCKYCVFSLLRVFDVIFRNLKYVPKTYGSDVWLLCCTVGDSKLSAAETTIN